MAITITFPPNPEPDVDFYRVYRGTLEAGPFTVIGTIPHNGLLAELQFIDPSGTLSHWYKLTTVNTAGTESLATSAFQPINEAALTRVFDVITDASLNPIAGIQVEARLTVKQAHYQGTIVAPQVVQTISDQNGFWFLDLFPNASLTPANSKYLITIQGLTVSKKITVPDSAATVRYADLVTLP